MAYVYSIGFSTGFREVQRPAATPPVAPDDAVQAPLPDLLVTAGYTIEVGGYALDGTPRPADLVRAATLTIEPYTDGDE